MAYYGGNNVGAQWQSNSIKAFFALFCMTAVVVVLVVLWPRDEPVKQQIVREVVIEKVAEAPTERAQAALTANVLVARENIWSGQKLSPDQFTMEERIIAGVENQIVRDPAQIKNLYAASNIMSGATLVGQHVTPLAPSRDVTSNIPPGYRAVAISVNAESAVEGWARPGSRVDVVWATNHNGRAVVTTIVENASVMSAARSTDTEEKAGESIPSHVTLLVTSADAQRIQLARTAGTLNLNLRGNDDYEKMGSGAINIGSLLRRRDLLSSTEIEGTVQFGGEEFVFRGGQLLPVGALEQE